MSSLLFDNSLLCELPQWLVLTCTQSLASLCNNSLTRVYLNYFTDFHTTNFAGGGQQNMWLWSLRVTLTVAFTGEAPPKHMLLYVGFEVSTAVITKSTMFWDIMSCSPLKVIRRFRWKFILHLRSWISRARYLHEIRWQAEPLLWFRW
jgi:hypothetical protein